MLTIDTLKAYGANVDEGVVRCMGNEQFYMKLVRKFLEDTRLDTLEQQLAQGDLDSAFETAHALKGMCANLAITPMTQPVSEMTELLRQRTQMDYSGLLAQAKEQFEKLKSI